MATHKPFRELIAPGTNFEFVGRTKVWVVLSMLLIVGSIAMLFVNKSVRGDYLNWTIDFKGGTEIIWEFRDAKDSNTVVPKGSGEVRKALQAAGFEGFDVSEFEWTNETTGKSVPGILVRTPLFTAIDTAKADEVKRELWKEFKDREVLNASWSGDRMFVRTKKSITWEEANQFFAKYSLELKSWGDEKERFTTAIEGTGEYEIQFAMWGVDRQFQVALEKGMPDIKAVPIQVDGVGAKAGKQLRNDGAKSLFYAMALIVLYLAFRFDIRFAPGAVAALLHDALLVVGVFAVTWTEVSLTSVAALLTVIGYSVNDTVVIFDRIRENIGRLKDKKLARVINISLNETLSRTLLTSLTLLVVTMMMNVFGTGLVKNFAFAMNIGVVVGVYSSVFVASPLLLYIHNRFYAGSSNPRASK